jgi:hypothetical protein
MQEIRRMARAKQVQPVNKLTQLRVILIVSLEKMMARRRRRSQECSVDSSTRRVEMAHPISLLVMQEVLQQEVLMEPSLT